MLRKALAEEESRRQQKPEGLAEPPREQSSLLVVGGDQTAPVYGTQQTEESKAKPTSLDHESSSVAVSGSNREYPLSDDGEDDDGVSSDEDEDGSIDDIVPPPSSIVWSIWSLITQTVRVVANVDNLWDSPMTNNPTSNTSLHRMTAPSLPTYGTTSVSVTTARQRRNKLLVLFWFVIVATSYAGERSSFKWLVDRTGPFRLVMVQIVVLTNAILMGILYAVSTPRRRALGVSVVDVGIMAVLDTLAMLIMFIAGAKVPPTLTVILLQLNIPLMAFWTHFRRRSTEFVGLDLSHWVGSAILTGAVALALIPSVISLLNPEFFLYADAIPLRTAVQTLFYVSSCIPAAASQLYKEHVFLQYKQPVNMELLNMLLSIFQFILASILSPLAFVLQGLGFRDDWTHAYESSQFGDDAVDAIRCFFGQSSRDADYPEEARCSFVGILVFFHVLSVASVGVAVDRIVNAGATKVMYRGISAGIILAVLVMHVYDMRTPTFNYGPAVDALNFACLIMLIVGTEIYHRSGIPDSTFETVYPPVEFEGMELRA
jgi:CRT-like, chloroquine-resistance transporter-like